MDIFVANEQQVPVDESRLSELARHTLEAERVDEEAELSVLLVTSGHIERLNYRYAGERTATDVLSFPMSEDGDGDDELVLGDVVICPEVARRNVENMDHSLDRELDILLVHGTLHLLGYDHQAKEDSARMDARLRRIVDSFHPRR